MWHMLYLRSKLHEMGICTGSSDPRSTLLDLIMRETHEHYHPDFVTGSEPRQCKSLCTWPGWMAAWMIQLGIFALMLGVLFTCTCASQGHNPKYSHTFRDESYMSTCKALAQACHRATLESSFLQRVYSQFPVPKFRG